MNEIWSEDLMVGHLLLDGEHKHILDILSAFILSSENEKEFYLQSLSLLEDAVKDHVSLHFAHEESLMQLYGCSEEQIAEHKKEHEEIRAKLISLRISYTSTTQPTVENMKSYAQKVAEEIYKHISNLDKELWGPIHSHWVRTPRKLKR